MNQTATAFFESLQAALKIGDHAALRTLCAPHADSADADVRTLAHLGLMHGYSIPGDLPAAFRHRDVMVQAARDGVSQDVLCRALIAESGNRYALTHQTETALEGATQALSIAQTLADQTLISEAYNMMALAAWTLRRTSDARVYADAALQAADAVNDPEAGSAALNTRALITFELERKHEQGIALFRRALDVAHRHDVRLSECIMCANFATTLAARRGFRTQDEVQSLIERAFALAAQTGSVYGRLSALQAQYALYFHGHDFEQAYTAADTLAALAQQHGYALWEWRAVGYQAMVRQAQKRFDEALALFEQQSAMPPEAKMPMADAHTLLTIGNVHYVARRRGQAVTYWQQAQAAAQADGVDFVRQMPFLSRVVYHYEGWFQRLFPNRR